MHLFDQVPAANNDGSVSIVWVVEFVIEQAWKFFPLFKITRDDELKLPGAFRVDAVHTRNPASRSVR